MPSLSETWGTTTAERRLAFPCDELISQSDSALYRGVTISASPEVIFSWLCQMRVAPYSYDLIDNCGRQSPRRLIQGLDQLAIGQDVMRIFKLVAFARNKHLTLRMKSGTRASRLFGDIAVSYLIVSTSAANSRLLVKMIVRYPRGAGGLLRGFLPWGDLIMMRRQLLNFKALAEQTSRSL